MFWTLVGKGEEEKRDEKRGVQRTRVKVQRMCNVSLLYEVGGWQMLKVESDITMMLKGLL